MKPEDLTQEKKQELQELLERIVRDDDEDVQEGRDQVSQALGIIGSTEKEDPGPCQEQEDNRSASERYADKLREEAAQENPPFIQPPLTPARFNNLIRNQYRDSFSSMNDRYLDYAFERTLEHYGPEAGTLAAELICTSQGVRQLTRKVNLLIKLCVGSCIVALAALILALTI